MSEDARKIKTDINKKADRKEAKESSNKKEKVEAWLKVLEGKTEGEDNMTFLFKDDITSERKNRYLAAIQALRTGDGPLDFYDCKLTKVHLMLICEVLKARHANQNSGLNLTGEQNFDPKECADFIIEILRTKPNSFHTLCLPNVLEGNDEIQSLWKNETQGNTARILSFAESEKSSRSAKP